MMLRAYFWFCTQELLLAVLTRDTIRCRRLNLGYHVQGKHPIYWAIILARCCFTLDLGVNCVQAFSLFQQERAIEEMSEGTSLVPSEFCVHSYSSSICLHIA